jgi:hypothetical protein
MVKIMKYFFQAILFFCICIIGCRNVSDRDKIVFKVPLSEIEDSIRVMNSLLNSYNEVNYYIDDENNLFVGTNGIGKIDSIILHQIKSNPLNFTNTDIRIFSIILFLKNNRINSCFRHRDIKAIVYDYNPTKKDRFEDVRYIVLNENQLYINSNEFHILDKKDNLLLITPVLR